MSLGGFANVLVEDADDVDRDEFWGEDPSEFFSRLEAARAEVSGVSERQRGNAGVVTATQLMFDGMENY